MRRLNAKLLYACLPGWHIFYILQCTILLVGAADRAANGSCSQTKNATLKSPEDSLFYFSEKKLTWHAANYFCQLHNWHLMTPETYTVTLKLKGLLQFYDRTNEHFWTSGNKLEDRSNWLWGLRGSRITFTNWAPDKPNPEPTDEYCIELIGSSLKWNDILCDKHRKFICQKMYPYL